MTEAVRKVTFYLDPSCPWTWRTSRWLVDVTRAKDVPVEYRAFELSNGAPLDRVPEQFRAGATASRGFLRAVEKAHADSRDDVIGAVYTAYGTAVHDNKQTPSEDLVRQAFTDNGGGDYLNALGDDSLDAGVAAARAQAQQHSGDDSGSPVLVLKSEAGERGFFGPVLAPTPTGPDAERLWDLIVTAASVPQFFELKGRRTTSP